MTIFRQPPHLRVSDADRERMAAFLGRGCAEGRLSPEELSERLDAVYRALTYGELTRVASDLPAEPAPARRRRPLVPAVAVGAVVLALAAYGLAEALAAPEATLLTLFLLIVVAFAVVAVVGSLALAVAPVVALVAGVAWLRRWLERDAHPRLLRPDRVL